MNLFTDYEDCASCEHWHLLSYGFAISSTEYGGYIRDVDNNIEYDPSLTHNGRFYADRGFNIIHIRRSWTGCKRSKWLVFDTHSPTRPDVTHFKNFLRDHVFPGDVIVAVAIDEAEESLATAMSTLLDSFQINLQSLTYRCDHRFLSAKPLQRVPYYQILP